MIKRFLVVVFCIIISNASVFALTADSTKAADNTAQIQTETLLDKIKSHRTAIYNSLELSSQQVGKIQELDKKFYVEVEPELKKLDYLVKKTHDIAYSDDCTKEAVNNLKKEFKSVEKDMNVVKKGYDKEFIKILSNEQKSKYRLIRKQMRAELKKELEKQRLLQKEQTKNGSDI